MAKKQKYYVVWVGKKAGVYTTWAATQTQTKGFPSAKYKS
ncbi:MAG TPA: ribonuclease H, partial [Bacteroidetes bacterium]|nr:ribonuclease H [Bacteroidota bacterium]